MDQERSKRRMRVSARENIDDVTTKTTTAILIPCYNEELTVAEVSSLQHALFSVEDNWNTSSEFQKGSKELSYLLMLSKPRINGRKASGTITEPSAC